VLPFVQNFADWARENPDTFKTVAAAIGVVAASIIAVNIAMMFNPFVLIAAGIGLIALAMTQHGPQIEQFFDRLKEKVENMLGPFAILLTQVFSLGNFMSGDVGGGTGFGGVLSRVLGTGKTLFPGLGALSGVLPFMADGGIVTGPQLLVAGEAGPEAIIPLDKLGQMGGGNNVVINVNGGDPQAVVDALRRYMQINGTVPIRVS
jgi:hypothetical protein